MTTADLIERLASGEGPVEIWLWHAIAKQCGVEVSSDAMWNIMRRVEFECERDACAALQEEVLPGLRLYVYQNAYSWTVSLADDEPQMIYTGTHPTNECRAHLIAILRAKEAQGYG